MFEDEKGPTEESPCLLDQRLRSWIQKVALKLYNVSSAGITSVSAVWAMNRYVVGDRGRWLFGARSNPVLVRKSLTNVCTYFADFYPGKQSDRFLFDLHVENVVERLNLIDQHTCSTCQGSEF